MIKQLKPTTLLIVLLLNIHSFALAEKERPANKYAKFEQVNQNDLNLLKIELKEPAKLLSIKVIGVTGQDYGTYKFDGNSNKSVQIDLKDMPAGPHMFKFLFKDKKEINEIFRICNEK